MEKEKVEAAVNNLTTLINVSLQNGVFKSLQDVEVMRDALATVKAIAVENVGLIEDKDGLEKTVQDLETQIANK